MNRRELPEANGWPERQDETVRSSCNQTFCGASENKRSAGHRQAVVTIWHQCSGEFSRSVAGIVEQELDESLLWMELLVESEIIGMIRMEELMKETDKLIRIIVKAICSTKAARD